MWVRKSAFFYGNKACGNSLPSVEKDALNKGIVVSVIVIIALAMICIVYSINKQENELRKRCTLQTQGGVSPQHFKRVVIG